MKFKLKSTTSKEQGSKRTPKGRNKRNATVALKPAVQDERPLGYDLPDDPIMPYENSDEEWEALDSNSTSVPTQNLSEQGHSTTNIVIDDVLARECCEKLEELRDQVC